jgi:hypothetical protein
MIKTTKERILDQAVKLWPHVTYQSVAVLLKMTHPAIIYHFPQGMLKEAVAEHAVKTGYSRTIVQLIGEGHPAVKDLSPSEKTRHFDHVTSS